MHALRQFTAEHPDIDKAWFEQSNYLGLLSVQNEEELVRLLADANERGIETSVFREPDIDNQMTAIALSPGPKSKKLCSRLPLALRGSR